jgi:hypothetical protein
MILPGCDRNNRALAGTDCPPERGDANTMAVAYHGAHTRV